MPLPRRSSAVLLLLAAPLATAHAQAEVRRCVTDTGETIYTDRRCDDVGAAERVPSVAGDAASGGRLALRPGCSRRLQDLTAQLTAAIHHRDANQLASLYHWPGIGTRGGYAIMDRLDAIAQRPLVDVRPLYRAVASAPATPSSATPSPAAAAGGVPATGSAPATPAAEQPVQGGAPWRPSTAQASLAPAGAGVRTAGMPSPAGAAGSAPAATTAASPPAQRSIPYALQIEQTLLNTATPSRTVFDLRRHLGCWWLSL